MLDFLVEVGVPEQVAILIGFEHICFISVLGGVSDCEARHHDAIVTGDRNVGGGREVSGGDGTSPLEHACATELGQQSRARRGPREFLNEASHYYFPSGIGFERHWRDSIVCNFHLGRPHDTANAGRLEHNARLGGARCRLHFEGDGYISIGQNITDWRGVLILGADEAESRARQQRAGRAPARESGSKKDDE